MYFEEKVDHLIELVKALGLAPDAAPTATKRRGRPAKGEADGVATEPAAAAVATPSATEHSASAASISPSDDPFADAAPANEPPVPISEVRAAVLALRDATDQSTALAILKKHGASNFGDIKPEVTGNILRDAKAAMPKAVVAAIDADPFAEPTTPAAPSPFTIDDVKKEIVKAQKRTSTDAVQKVVMSFGGVAAGAGGTSGPSLKALPADKYAATIAAIQALPTTK